MAVDDLWYLTRRDPETGQRRPSKRHGRGKRWRVRWSDPHTGETRTALFERKADAERHDASMLADISRGQYVDPRAGTITIAEYASQWRAQQLHRDSTIDIVERAFRLHILPMLGQLPMADVLKSHSSMGQGDSREPVLLHRSPCLQLHQVNVRRGHN